MQIWNEIRTTGAETFSDGVIAIIITVMSLQLLPGIGADVTDGQILDHVSRLLRQLVVSSPFEVVIQSKGLPWRAVKVPRVARAKDPDSVTLSLIRAYALFMRTSHTRDSSLRANPGPRASL
jgi:hypothetical protein